MINKNNDFCHLHLHTSHSLLDGLGLPEQWAQKASEMQFKYLACTNHGASDGLLKFQLACEKYNVIPILGVEGYIVPKAEEKNKGEKRAHITIWIRDFQGYQNVLKMLTKANLYYFYHRPRFDFDLVLEHTEGLCIGTACSSSFIHLDGGIDFFKKLNNKIGENLYCEVMSHDYPEQVDTNNKVLDLAEKYKRKIICTQDCHYIEQEDWESHDVLLAIQTCKKLNDPSRWIFNGKNFFLCSSEYQKERFKEQGVLYESEVKEGQKNTIEIAEKCSSFKIEKREIKLPMPPQFTGRNEDEVLKELIISGFKKRFGVNIEL